MAFTDGRLVGATLDRNGLRPGRWTVTKDGYVILGSECGLLDMPVARVERLGRLQPGKLFLVDLERGRRIVGGRRGRKHAVATQKPYAEWYARCAVPFEELEPYEQLTSTGGPPLHTCQRAFGYSQEDLRVLLGPTARDAQEPIGSMGNDLTLAVLSDQAPPPVLLLQAALRPGHRTRRSTPIREEVVMSLATTLGSERNLFDETPEHAHKLVLESPILLNRELETLRHVDHDVFKAFTIDIIWAVHEAPAGMARARPGVCREATRAIKEGVNIIILSDLRDQPHAGSHTVVAGGRLRAPSPRA